MTPLAIKISFLVTFPSPLRSGNFFFFFTEPPLAFLVIEFPIKGKRPITFSLVVGITDTFLESLFFKFTHYLPRLAIP